MTSTAARTPAASDAATTRAIRRRRVRAGTTQACLRSGLRRATGGGRYRLELDTKVAGAVPAAARILVQAPPNTRAKGGRERRRQQRPVRLSGAAPTPAPPTRRRRQRPAAPSASRRARPRRPRCRRARSTGRPFACSGRHIRRRAQDHPSLRQRGRGNGRGQRVVHAAAAPVRLHRLGQPEVQHLHGAVGPHLDVGGLQIAMDDALLVRRLQRLGDLRRDRQGVSSIGTAPRAIRCDRSSPSTSSITSARHTTRFLEAVNVRDVGMVQRGKRLGFPCEPRQSIGVAGERVGQHLERHVAARASCRGPDTPAPIPPSPIWAVTS